MDREDIDETNDGKNLQHVLLRLGQLQINPGVPGVLPLTHKRG